MLDIKFSRENKEIVQAGSKKKRVAMIIAKLSPAKPTEDSAPEQHEDQEDDSMAMGLESAAEDIMAAISSKDPKSLAAAMKSFISMCGDYEEQPEESPEPSEA